MRQIDFSDNRVFRNIIAASLPMLLAQVVHLLYSIVDRIYIGNIPGSGMEALGGVGLCFPIITMIMAFTFLYSGGGAPLFAIARGRGDQETADRILSLTFWLEIVTSVALLAVGYLFGRQLLFLFGASDASIKYALPYLNIYLIGTTFSMIGTGMNSFIAAEGFALMGMTTVTVGAVCNIVLDPIFIFVFGMGVVGAAIATVIAQVISAVITVWFLRSRHMKSRLTYLRFREVAAQGRQIRDILSLGLSSFIMMMTNSAVQIASNSVLSHTGGDMYVSIMTIVNSVRQIMETPIGAVAEGSSPVLSFNYGAEKPESVKRGIRIMTSLCLVYTAVMWAVIMLWPGVFIRIFGSDQTMLSEAIPAMRIYFVGFMFMTLQICGQTTFKALNYKKHAIFFSILRKILIVVPLTYLLPYTFHMGTDGVFAAEPISNLLGGTACFVTMTLVCYRNLGSSEDGGESSKATH